MHNKIMIFVEFDEVEILVVSPIYVFDQVVPAFMRAIPGDIWIDVLIVKPFHAQYAEVFDLSFVSKGENNEN